MSKASEWLKKNIRIAQYREWYQEQAAQYPDRVDEGMSGDEYLIDGGHRFQLLPSQDAMSGDPEWEMLELKPGGDLNNDDDWGITETFSDIAEALQYVDSKSAQAVPPQVPQAQPAAPATPPGPDPRINEIQERLYDLTQQGAYTSPEYQKLSQEYEFLTGKRPSSALAWVARNVKFAQAQEQFSAHEQDKMVSKKPSTIRIECPDCGSLIEISIGDVKTLDHAGEGYNPEGFMASDGPPKHEAPLPPAMARRILAQSLKNQEDAVEDRLLSALDRDVKGYRFITEDELREFSKQLKDLDKTEHKAPEGKKE